jgi:cytochrome P450
MLRAIVASAFSPIMISKLEPRIESITHDLINQVIDKGNMDLITDLAYSLPVIVIAELLGLPLVDRDIFCVWADKIASSTNNDDSYSTNTDNFLNLQSEMMIISMRL